VEPPAATGSAGLVTRRSAAFVAYFALAIACGVILGTGVPPWPTDVFVLLGLGLVARLLRREVEPRPGSLRLVLAWLGAFVVTWLVLAFALGTYPF
jgi:hypothetical protein